MCCIEVEEADDIDFVFLIQGFGEFLLFGAAGSLLRKNIMLSTKLSIFIVGLFTAGFDQSCHSVKQKLVCAFTDTHIFKQA